MTKEMKSCGSRVLVPVIGAFVEMSSDVEALADITTSALAADHIQFFSTSAAEAKGVYKQRIRTAWGHAAHRGWARLLLDRRRDLIVHGPRATRNAGGNSTTRSSSGTTRETPTALGSSTPRLRLAPLRHPCPAILLILQCIFVGRDGLIPRPFEK